MGRGYAPMFHWAYNRLSLFTDEEFGRLARAVLAYDIDGIETEFNDRAMAVVYDEWKTGADSCRAKYEKRCAVNQENGRKPKKSKAIASDGYDSLPTANDGEGLLEVAYKTRNIK